MDTWNPKQPFINGCLVNQPFSTWRFGIIPLKQPFINGCFGFQVESSNLKLTSKRVVAVSWSSSFFPPGWNISWSWIFFKFTPYDRCLYVGVSKNRGKTPKMDGLKWKILWKWMIWGENLHYFWKHPYIHTFFGIHTKKRQTALNQDAGLEYDFFTWNSAISTLEKRRRWQVRTVIHASQKKKVWWIMCKKAEKNGSLTWSSWWFHPYFLSSPRALGIHDPIWWAYFSIGLNHQPVVVSCHHFLGKNWKQENITTFFCRKVWFFCWCPRLFWGWVILLTYPPEN